MKTGQYKRTWRRRASWVPPYRVYSWRDSDRLVNGVVVPGVEYAVMTSGRYRKRKQ